MREEEKFNSQKSKSQQFFKKRWVFPAIYLASAAIILTAVLWYQSSGSEIAKPLEIDTNNQSDGTAYNQNQEAIPVTQTVEKFSMPVVDANSIEIQKHYYDDKASVEEQEAALVFYNNTYTGNTGIDIVSKNGESFDVVASLSGTVTKALKDPLLGYVVEVDHGNGVTTMYSALENVKVEQGATVSQGELLATAGRSLYNNEAGVHTHFEIRKDGEPVNPLDFFEKTLSSLEEDTNKEENQDASTKEEEEQPGEGEGDSEEDQTETPDASIGQGQA